MVRGSAGMAGHELLQIRYPGVPHGVGVSPPLHSLHRLPPWSLQGLHVGSLRQVRLPHVIDDLVLAAPALPDDGGEPGHLPRRNGKQRNDHGGTCHGLKVGPANDYHAPYPVMGSRSVNMLFSSKDWISVIKNAASAQFKGNILKSKR